MTDFLIVGGLVFALILGVMLILLEVAVALEVGYFDAFIERRIEKWTERVERKSR